MTTFKALQKFVSALLSLFVILGVVAPQALAENHPFLFSFGSFSNPNGIAVDESTGDVYVADIATDTVSRFDADGNPVEFPGLHSNALSGSATPAGSFDFPEGPGTPAAIAIDNSTSASDPSAGDLYIVDAGHHVVDKFDADGRYLNQITFEEGHGEPAGIGVDASGKVYISGNFDSADFYGYGHEFGSAGKYQFNVHIFNNSLANSVIMMRQPLAAETQPVVEDVFAVSATGDMYIRQPCGCLLKYPISMENLGRADRGPDIAAAVDPATGHVYADEQSSVSEWDTGEMNGQEKVRESSEAKTTGTLVSSFGGLRLSGSSGQGAIAVNGASGDVYVANPSDGKVYVFAASAPGVAADVATDVTQGGATLQGSVNPHGSAVTSCSFEYERASLSYEGSLTPAVTSFKHSAPCDQTPVQIGSGTSPVTVTAEIAGLIPGVLYHYRLSAANANGTSYSGGLFATQGQGFGIKAFEVAFLNKDGSPDIQAGSHPYEMKTSISYNSTVLRNVPNSDSIYMQYPEGGDKDLTVDLPPGLVGDPNATAKKCTLKQVDVTGENVGESQVEGLEPCPAESVIGELEVEVGGPKILTGLFHRPVYNMVPPHGVAAQVAVHLLVPNVFIDADVPAGGEYPVQATLKGIPIVEPVIRTTLTMFGVVGEGATRKAFLTLPTRCTGPLRSSMSMDSYQEPGHYVSASSVTRNSAGQPISLTGCSQLRFPPTITASPDTTNASTSSGLTVGVHISQKAAQNPEGLAESALRDTTVTLPEGVALNPAGANGLEACSEGLAGFAGFSEFNSEFESGVKTATFTPEMPQPLQPGTNFCPDGSKIGTVKIHTPLLENPLEGAVYLAAQNANPFGSLVAMYMIAEDPVSGTIIKLTGEVHLTETGQIVTTFKNTPDLPFEELELRFFGGERAPLTTPSRCGTYTTQASFVPWDGNGPVNTSSSFQITSGPNGTPCPGASLPFSPSLTGGATNVNAGAFSPFTLTMTRKDGEQNLQSVEAHLPPGLSGVLSNIELCREPQANLGECPSNSLIGETTISVGVGGDPFSVTGGKFYLTGPYDGSGGCTVGQSGCAPFGITFEVPAKAGPFDLKRNTANPASEDPCDCVLVRGKIEVNPITAAITITSNPPGTPDSIPTSIEGIPLEIQHVNATTTRGDFQFNPTNCNKMGVTGTIHSSEGSTDTIDVPFQVTNCAVLKFAPKLAVSASGKTSRANGASLNVKLTYPKAPFGSQANIKSVKVDLPKQLPSRLTTLQKACPAKTFEVDPAGCPAASIVGHATAITPLIPVPLTGPAYFVSYGGAKFPELVVVLQGYGVTLDLHGETFISKAGITSSTFHTIPDAPVGSFELNLPQGKFSALAANGNLCKSKLAMPTAFTAQNGMEIHQSTKIGVTGCSKAKKKGKKSSKHHNGKTHGKKK